MLKHWAMVTWNGTHDMAEEEFTHVTWSGSTKEAAVGRAREWGEKSLSPAAQAGMTVQYLGKSDVI